MNRTDVENMLRIVSRAWGRTQSGFAFFPWIDREAQRTSGSRRAGFHEDRAFAWPEDRKAIVEHILAHSSHDVYWCPNLFEYPDRLEDNAMDEHSLWADLDEIDPRNIEDYKPTIAWETSPGRFQALWIAASGDFQGASWPGNENQRLTYHVEADKSGWDSTQLLRLPGWPNHKLDYRGASGTPPKGKVLWTNGPTYQPGDFRELPEVRGVSGANLTDALESDIDGVDRHKVIARIRLKLNKRARDLLVARETSGDVSSSLWYLTRCLADVGCSVAEIVAIVRETPWNKFRDRAEEMRILITEASKAIANRSEEVVEKIEESSETHRSTPTRFGALLKNVKRPKFLIEGVLTEGACGFIAGEPKSYKSWTAMDMAISVATGSDFLNEFRVNQPGPVLYIQEEDPLPTLKTRTAKIWAGKAVDKLKLETEPDGAPGVLWLPPDKSDEFDPNINGYVQEGFTISDEAWMIWADEVLSEGMADASGNTMPYALWIIDTLMMTAGDVDENKSQEMTTKIFRPLKVLSRKHNVAIQVVHHMGKSDASRPGKRMLGSTANHAWAEDSIYLSRPATGKDIRMDLESKSFNADPFRIKNLANLRWDPLVESWTAPAETQADATAAYVDFTNTNDAAPAKSAKRQMLGFIAEHANGVTQRQFAEYADVTPSTAYRRLQRCIKAGELTIHTDETGAKRYSIS